MMKRQRKSRGIHAQVRRLPSGQVQIKVPLKRGDNAMAKARQIAKALGRRILSVVNPRLGTGERFAACVRSVKAKGSAYDPEAVCAAAGRAKYGKRRFQKMALTGRMRHNPEKARKYVGGYYKVGEFFIHKAFIPMPKAERWSIYGREGQVVGRAGSLKAAIRKATEFMGA